MKSAYIKIRRTICLIIYHFLARYIPDRYFVEWFGIRLRRFCAERIFPECGWGLHLHPDVEIGRGDKIHIGDRCAIGSHCHLHAAHEHIYIGNYTQLGANIHIITNTHMWHRTDYPIQRQGSEFAPVKIGRDVQIGANAVIMPAVVVGDGAMVGANAVVTKDVSAYDIVGGVPAEVILNRKDYERRGIEPRRKRI